VTEMPDKGKWTADQPLLELRHLTTSYPVRAVALGRRPRRLRAVDDVDLSLWEGETLGLVGESGSGKTTLGRTILRLVAPTSGQVLFKGEDLARLSHAEMRRRRRNIAMIFQDPYASLDPRQTVGEIIGEALDIHGLAKGRTVRRERIAELLEMVGLNQRYGNRFPVEFSGGQRQRIGIARALAVEPSLVVCDEPISALDVSIQAQIINLLRHLQSEFNLTYLFIAHDLAVVEHISNRIAVMYLGKVVEVGPARQLFSKPKHPYTASLLSAIPVPDPALERGRKRIILKGDLPSPFAMPSGCRFRTRCFNAQARCAEGAPPLASVGMERHQVACFYPVGALDSITIKEDQILDHAVQ
jgi:oligopeptide transport system ATP-binding protein